MEQRCCEEAVLSELKGFLVVLSSGKDNPALSTKVGDPKGLSTSHGQTVDNPSRRFTTEATVQDNDTCTGRTRLETIGEFLHGDRRLTHGREVRVVRNQLVAGGPVTCEEHDNRVVFGRGTERLIQCCSDRSGGGSLVQEPLVCDPIDRILEESP